MCWLVNLLVFNINAYLALPTVNTKKENNTTHYRDEDEIPFDLRINTYLAKERDATQRRIETKQSLQSRWGKWIDTVNNGHPNGGEKVGTEIQKTGGKKGSLVLLSFVVFLSWTFLGMAGLYLTILKPIVILITGE